MFHKTPMGFMLDFPNGWTASVQFGPGNYCSNRDMDANPFRDNLPFLESETAEIGAWRTDTRGEDVPLYRSVWYKFEDGQEVNGWQNMTQVMEFINMVSSFRREGALTSDDVQVASKKWKPILKDWGIDY